MPDQTRLTDWTRPNGGRQSPSPRCLLRRRSHSYYYYYTSRVTYYGPLRFARVPRIPLHGEPRARARARALTVTAPRGKYHYCYYHKTRRTCHVCETSAGIIVGQNENRPDRDKSTAAAAALGGRLPAVYTLQPAHTIDCGIVQYRSRPYRPRTAQGV